MRELKEREGLSNTPALFFELHLFHSFSHAESIHTLEIENEAGDTQSKANTLATLPFLVGNTETITHILPMPNSHLATPEVKDTSNLHAILSAPMTATLPLVEFLKARPNMWKQVSKTLHVEDI